MERSKKNRINGGPANCWGRSPFVECKNALIGTNPMYEERQFKFNECDGGRTHLIPDDFSKDVNGSAVCSRWRTLHSCFHGVKSSFCEDSDPLLP